MTKERLTETDKTTVEDDDLEILAVIGPSSRSRPSNNTTQEEQQVGAQASRNQSARFSSPNDVLNMHSSRSSAQESLDAYRRVEDSSARYDCPNTSSRRGIHEAGYPLHSRIARQRLGNVIVYDPPVRSLPLGDHRYRPDERAGRSARMSFGFRIVRASDFRVRQTARKSTGFSKHQYPDKREKK